jgi:hypothetical protein
MNCLKKCNNCLIEKEFINFQKLKSTKDGLRPICKICRKIKEQKYKQKNLEYNKDYYKKNKTILKEKNKEYQIKNIISINKQRKEYRNREEIKAHIKEKNKEYNQIKKEKIKIKRKNDISFRINEVFRSKLHRKINKKSLQYNEYLGCNSEMLNKWLENNFDTQINWNNYGVIWHIDHVIPINLFDKTIDKDIKICFNWKNLCPLFAKENIAKSDNLKIKYIINHVKNVKKYINSNNLNDEYQGLIEMLIWLREKLRNGKNLEDEEINLLISEMENQQPSV